MKEYEEILTVSALDKRYGKTDVLRHLNMHVPSGSVYGLVGKNGAGKTTMIRIICGLQEPSAGGYTLFGISHGDADIVKARRRMGAVVETPALYPDMTAKDNLKQQALILGVPSYDFIPDLLSMVGLADTGSKKVRNFSLGMRQRLGIAVALVGNPDFILLDEPINGLDPQGIVEIRELILKLNRQCGITVLISSHILDELSKLATHYGFIDHGTLVKEITAKELEAACRKCVRLKVNDTKPLVRVLDAMQKEYELISDTEATVFGELHLSRLVFALDKEGGELISAHDCDETLETYFINLLGGEAHV